MFTLKELFKGNGVAVPLIYDARGEISFNVVKVLIRTLIESGVNFVELGGYAADCRLITLEQHKMIAKELIPYIRELEAHEGRKIGIIFGAISNVVNDCAQLIEAANQADAIYITEPYGSGESAYDFTKKIRNLFPQKKIILHTSWRCARIPFTQIMDMTNQRIINGIIWSFRDGRNHINDASTLYCKTAQKNKDFVILSEGLTFLQPLFTFGGRGAISLLPNIGPVISDEISRVNDYILNDCNAKGVRGIIKSYYELMELIHSNDAVIHHLIAKLNPYVGCGTVYLNPKMQALNKKELERLECILSKYPSLIPTEREKLTPEKIKKLAKAIVSSKE